MAVLLENLTDEELFPLVKQSDRKAFTVLYDRYKKPMINYTVKKVGVEHAVDIVHDVFAKIWSHRENIGNKEKFSWYLFHVLRNRIIDFIARSRHSSAYLQTLDINDKDLLDNATDYKVRVETFLGEIEMELAAFNPNAMKIIRRHLEGYKNHEIAAELNLQEKTIRNEKSKILKFLKSRYSGYFLISLLFS
ncbi:MAG: RNA polymerase sigma factor [Sphingobacterium hotanense]